MDDNQAANLAVVDGDGGTAAVTELELNGFKEELKRIGAEPNNNVWLRRVAAEETRYCLRDGKSPDGRKHADAQDGRPAFPFEGASDADIRLADMIVNERVLLLTAAAMRNLPRVKGLELEKEGLGAKLTTVLKWVIKNKLGGDYFRTITKLAQFREADSPAGAVLGIWWKQETALEMKTLSVQEIEQILVNEYGMAQEDIAGLEAMLANPDRDDESVQYLMQLIPYMKAKRAKLVVKELRENKKAEFPAPYLRLNQPELCAYRLLEDVFFPTNTTDFKKGRGFYIREWLAEWEVRERQVSYEWSEEFVTEVLKHEGASAFPTYRFNPVAGSFAIEQVQDKESNHGYYEVITAFYRAVNEDNIPGVYYVTFHHDVAVAAHDRKLLEYEHGEYPGVYFGREILTSRLLDARGIPELVATEQYQQKLFVDSFADYVSLSTVPPIKVPRRRSKLSLNIGPLKIIKEDRPGDVAFMTMPQYPVGNERQQAELMRRINEYWGRIAETVPGLLTQLHQNGLVLHFLTDLTDAIVQMLQLCQQFMSDEDLALITGDDGVPIAHSREEIQGKFSVELTFDPRDLDQEYLKRIIELIGLVLQWDTLSTIQRDKLVQRIFAAIDPHLAADTLTSVQNAQQSEIKDEENNFTQIKAGIEPEMVAEGQNFPLRLQVLTGIVQKNPEALQNMTPASRKIYDARMEYLQNQVQQIKNAQIGRQVGQPALGGNGE